MRISTLLTATLLLIASTIYGQDRPIGQWRAHLPYNTAVDIATDGIQLFVATEQAFYIYDQFANEVTAHSKVSGMSDIGMQGIAYDNISETVILTYTNSNIDLFKHNQFFNIPDLKLKTVTGSKSINDIYTEDGLAYLSTDIGIVVVNLDRKEIKETYTFTKNSQNIPINGLTADQSFFYAATDNGIYKADKNNPNLQAFSSWIPVDTLRSYIGIANQKGQIYTTLVDSLFLINNNTLTFLYDSDSNTKRLCPGNDGIWILENYDNFSGKCKKLSSDNVTFIDSFRMDGFPVRLLPTDYGDSTKWIANINSGLLKRTQKGDPYFVEGTPTGPEYFTTYDIYVNNKELIVAHGGYDDQYKPRNFGFGFSTMKNDDWTGYRLYSYPPFGDSVIDISNVLKAPNGDIYAGSTQSGLFILKPDGSYEYYKQNSIISPSSTGGNLYRISGITADEKGNVWMTVLGGTPNELIVHTTDGNWYGYGTLHNRSITHSAAHLIIDDYDQKWYAAPGSGGVIVYDDNGTPDNKADDRSTQLLAGEGSGGLPDNEVYCLANDNEGAIWIGTANGIGIVNCPNSVIDKQCEAEKRVVQFDDFAGYLFQNEQVKAIAVDGGNRKWIGTNNGVWLISPDGNEIIERFTADNSPLPSNIIQKIAIDPVTGDVYIGTELGLISYRGTAIDAKTNKSDDLITFPNPIPSGYSGTIAIKGLIENADVRITDVSGQLVYKTKALGGQAIWNGTDYTGRRVQSGVYLIFATNKDGSEAQTGKMVFME